MLEVSTALEASSRHPSKAPSTTITTSGDSSLEQESGQSWKQNPGHQLEVVIGKYERSVYLYSLRLPISELIHLQRSMTYFKNYIILFGGFQDTSQQTKYLQDVWMYDTQRFTWHTPALPPASQKPDARSSFTFLPHETGAVLYGGYSRVKATSTAAKATKGGRSGSKVTMKPVIHQDTWFLRITLPAQDAPANAPPVVRWERRKSEMKTSMWAALAELTNTLLPKGPVNGPNPPRAGATQAYHKGRGICFGGVHDVEESEEGIDSSYSYQSTSDRIRDKC